MKVRVNDTPHSVVEHATLHDLLVELGHAAKRGVAVAVNDDVVTRTRWPAHKLAEDDRILVIQATQGG